MYWLKVSRRFCTREKNILFSFHKDTLAISTVPHHFLLPGIDDPL